MTYKTDQENFWAGDFGSAYVDRNRGEKLLASNIAFFAKALARTVGLSSCIELGANIGMNIKSLQLLHPEMENHAVEINSRAVAELKHVIPENNIYHTSILDFVPNRTWDLAFVKGVLIHINPDWLTQAYDMLHRASHRYILLCEYYNPSPVSIVYRGHQHRLFKRDFCGEILERHTDLQLVDYGFVYRHDPNFPQDDMTWFLLGKEV